MENATRSGLETAFVYYHPSLYFLELLLWAYIMDVFTFGGFEFVGIACGVTVRMERRWRQDGQYQSNVGVRFHGLTGCAKGSSIGVTMTEEERATFEKNRKFWDESLKKEERAKTFWKYTSFALFLAVVWLTAAVNGCLRAR